MLLLRFIRMGWFFFNLFFKYKVCGKWIEGEKYGFVIYNLYWEDEVSRVFIFNCLFNKFGKWFYFMWKVVKVLMYESKMGWFEVVFKLLVCYNI